MTLDELDRWLDTYGRAWEHKDADAFTGCFTDAALYAWGPWDEPLHGRAEIRDRFERATARQEGVKFGHEPLAITPDGRGVARWWVSMDVPEDSVVEEDEGVFLVTLDGDGLCSEFREWWNGRTRPA